MNSGLLELIVRAVVVESCLKVLGRAERRPRGKSEACWEQVAMTSGNRARCGRSACLRAMDGRETHQDTGSKG